MNHRNQLFWLMDDAIDLLSNAERLRRRLFLLSEFQPVPCWTPAVDLYQQDGDLRLIVALPGVEPGEFEVLLEDGSVLIRGNRSIRPLLQKGSIHRLEIPYGRFERRVEIPYPHFRVHEQSLAGGCLVLVLRHL